MREPFVAEDFPRRRKTKASVMVGAFVRHSGCSGHGRQFDPETQHIFSRLDVGTCERLSIQRCFVVSVTTMPNRA